MPNHLKKVTPGWSWQQISLSYQPCGVTSEHSNSATSKCTLKNVFLVYLSQTKSTQSTKIQFKMYIHKHWTQTFIKLVHSVFNTTFVSKRKTRKSIQTSTCCHHWPFQFLHTRIKKNNKKKWTAAAERKKKKEEKNHSKEHYVNA